MTDDELWTVTPIPRADVKKVTRDGWTWELGGDDGLIDVLAPEPWMPRDQVILVFDPRRTAMPAGEFLPAIPDEPAALVPDPLRRRTLLDRLCWWRR